MKRDNNTTFAKLEYENSDVSEREMITKSALGVATSFNLNCYQKSDQEKIIDWIKKWCLNL